MRKDEKAAYWRRQVDGQRVSGLSVKEYCQREGIAVATWYYWCKRFTDAQGSRAVVSGRDGFVPVTLKPVSPSVSPVEIRLLSGRSLKLTAPMDTGWLHTLVRVLESPCG